MYECVSLRVCAHVCVYVCASLSVHVCECVSLRVCECVCECVSVCVHARVYEMIIHKQRESFNQVKPPNTKFSFGFGFFV